MAHYAPVLLCLVAIQVHMAASILPSLDEPASGMLRVYALPVGQGDGTVIQCPKESGGYLNIVDLGCSDCYISDAEYRNLFANQLVENIILTHPDPEHINHISYIPKPSENVYHACHTEQYLQLLNETGYAYLNTLKGEQRLRPITHTDAMSTGIACVGKNCNYETIYICNRAAKLRILGANLGGNGCDPAHNVNRDSLVTQLMYGDFKLLLPGGLEDDRDNAVPRKPIDGTSGRQADMQQILINAHRTTLESNFMRLADHGAFGRGNKRYFLKLVKPRAVFSSSAVAPNMYNQPNCKLIDNLINDLTLQRLAPTDESTYYSQGSYSCTVSPTVADCAQFDHKSGPWTQGTFAPHDEPMTRDDMYTKKGGSYFFDEWDHAVYTTAPGYTDYLIRRSIIVMETDGITHRIWTRDGELKKYY